MRAREESPRGRGGKEIRVSSHLKLRSCCSLLLVSSSSQQQHGPLRSAAAGGVLTVSVCLFRVETRRAPPTLLPPWLAFVSHSLSQAAYCSSMASPLLLLPLQVFNCMTPLLHSALLLLHAPPWQLLPLPSPISLFRLRFLPASITLFTLFLFFLFCIVQPRHLSSPAGSFLWNPCLAVKLRGDHFS